MCLKQPVAISDYRKSFSTICSGLTIAYIALAMTERVDAIAGENEELHRPVDSLWIMDEAQATHGPAAINSNSRHVTFIIRLRHRRCFNITTRVRYCYRLHPVMRRRVIGQ